MAQGDILGLTINHNEHLDGTLYRLKRGTRLRIVPGASILGRHVALYTNYPVADATTPFKRNTFHQLTWYKKNGGNLTSDSYVAVTSLDIYCEIVANVSGSFQFYIEYEGQ